MKWNSSLIPDVDCTWFVVDYEDGEGKFGQLRHRQAVVLHGAFPISVETLIQPIKPPTREVAGC